MTTAIARPPIRLLVCGNVDRRDDGAALWAAAHLLPGPSPEHLPGIDVRQCGQLDIDHLVDAGRGAPTIIIDTAVGVPPGRVVTLTFDELLAGTHKGAPHSSHALPIDQVIGVARQLSDAPVDGLFVGIGAGDLGFGRGLSQPVREGMGEYVVAIHRALMRVASQTLSLAGR
jgi:hydrogenase maturation protease